MQLFYFSKNCNYILYKHVWKVFISDTIKYNITEHFILIHDIVHGKYLVDHIASACIIITLRIINTLYANESIESLRTNKPFCC